MLRALVVLMVALPAVVSVAAAATSDDGSATAAAAGAAMGALTAEGAGARTSSPAVDAGPTPGATPATSAGDAAPGGGQAQVEAGRSTPHAARGRLQPAASAVVHRVVGLGDSVPAGTSCDCTDYVALLARGLGADVTSTNLAVPGQTSQGLLDQLSDADVRTALADADLVVVTIGANDLEYGQDPASCAAGANDPVVCYSTELAGLDARLGRITSGIAALTTHPGARIALTGYWNVFLDGKVARDRGTGYTAVADAATKQVNTRLETAAEQSGAVFVDLFTPFRGADGSKDCTALLAGDGDHPDAAGHAAIARAVQASL